MDAPVKAAAINSERPKPCKWRWPRSKTVWQGTIMRLGEGEVEDIQVVSTGSLGLDIALGMGGLPRAGRRNLRPNPPAKPPDVAVDAQMQKQGRHLRLCRRRARAGRAVRTKVGREPRRPADFPARYRRAGLKSWTCLVRSGAVDLIIVDSVAALTPRPNWKAKWATLCRACRLAPHEPRPCASSPAHQEDQLHGHLHQPDPHEDRRRCSARRETTTGGNALKFYASVRLDIRRTGTIKRATRLSAAKPRSKW